MSDTPFKRFLDENHLYSHLFENLSEKNELLARSAETVFCMHGAKLSSYASDILSFLEESEYAADYVDRFINRIAYLNGLQDRFDAEPTPGNLCDPFTKIDRGDYNIALLLSILVSNHRMEIMQNLKEFLSFVNKPTGRIASVGMGTGYELKLVADTLPGWCIEGYDTDEKTHEDVKRLLQFFNVKNDISLRFLFPNDRPDEGGPYNALLLCELLEHLEDPPGFLKMAKSFLSPDGFMFVTMAVNIAQEDHIYLYPTIDRCRKELSDTGLMILFEKISPMTIRPLSPSENRQKIFSRGNYMAVVR